MPGHGAKTPGREKCVNVKAKTTEKLGYLGREEGMAAEAICLLIKASAA